MNTKKPSAFSEHIGNLGPGLDSFFSNPDKQLSMVEVSSIIVTTQVREVFEDEQHPLQGLADSIRDHGLIQPVLLRPRGDEYHLVAGERRLRAAKLAGLDVIPAYIRELTDEEAEDVQMAENIHRKNLTQMEEAKKIQRDIDRFKQTMGAESCIQAVLEKHRKSRAWLSKMLSLLSLPEETSRLVDNNVTADVEVINTIKGIEKRDPEKARQVVDKLIEAKGKGAREVATTALKDLKAPKAETPQTVAAGSTEKASPALSLPQILDDLYKEIYEAEQNPKSVFLGLSDKHKRQVEKHLERFHEAGATDKKKTRGVLKGLREGSFAAEGGKLLALIAFLKGVDGEKFDVFDILSAVGR